MLWLVCAALPALAVGGVLFYRLYWQSWASMPWVLGATLGTVANLSKVLLLEFTVSRAIAMDKQKSVNFVRLMHLARLFAAAVVLFIAAFVPFINLWGAAATLLSFQLITYSMKFFWKEAR